MSQFCSNCGAQLGENVAFCQNCGTPVAQDTNPQPQSYSPQPQNVNPQPQQQNFNSYPNYPPQAPQAPQAPQGYPGGGYYPPKKKPSKGLLLGIGIGAVALIVILIILLTSGGGGYKGVVDKYFDSISAGKVKIMLSCFPPEFQDSMDDYMIEEAESYMEMIDSVKYKITDSERLEEDDIEDLEDDYSYYGDIDIQDAYLLEIDVTVKMDYSAMDDEYSEYYEDMDDEMEESIEITVVKLKGKWYLIDDSMF